ncbi:hypothetical protein S-PM2d058 [Synechococcus phage S-PM2]|uniref:Hypothetical-Protein / belonging to T4-LIKE GC: 801 n=1 Tax=Synechococcus phage S-PM2 TaxID=238854 RepID=Q5GQX8_BPSYP|nr:Hypothetical-Protein / belonging to T4-LIKE GC: 801 [Synechococcus phage S-PM2]CAF34122.1 Hypothetical-Protein / belonging to T4-LIKE GC: 801 [Synechococcus phage S-PM2]CFW42169.1 hypothetical protein S-PM2d058 [Synechococcus phage S-PM2]
MNIIADHVAQLVRFKQPVKGPVIQPLPPQDEDLASKYWRYFSKFPNEFASGLAKALPPGLEFVQYDHLTNQLIIQ